MPRRARALLPLVLVAGLAAAGCEPSAPRVADRGIRVIETEYRLRPQNITVSAGEVTFVAVDRGRLIHNLAIERIPDDPDTTPVPLARSESLHPGEESRPFTVRLRPGKYRMVCTIGNHDDLGQYGYLYVTK